MPLSDQEIKKLFKKLENDIIDDNLKDLPSDDELIKAHPVSEDFDKRILKIIRGADNDKDK